MSTSAAQNGAVASVRASLDSGIAFAREKRGQAPKAGATEATTARTTRLVPVKDPDEAVLADTVLSRRCIVMTINSWNPVFLILPA